MNAAWQVGDVLTRDGKLYEIVRITAAGAAGTRASDGPTFHARIMRDGLSVPGAFVADVWSGSLSHPVSAYALADTP